MSKQRVAITGASSGIGRAIALEFASRGFDLLLTARDEEALEAVASECRKSGAEAAVFAADLADAASVDALVMALPGIDILVNNAGFAVKGDFVRTPLEDELKMLDVQLAAMLKLTKAALPEMIGKGSGRILNIASVYSYSPVPRQSVYSACKAFLLSFSSALNAEVRGKGVTVTVVLPGITQTEFRTRAGIADKKDSGMTAGEVAKIAVEAALKGRHIVTPGGQNKVFVFLARHLPRSLMARVVTFINNRRGVNK